MRSSTTPRLLCTGYGFRKPYEACALVELGCKDVTDTLISSILPMLYHAPLLDTPERICAFDSSVVGNDRAVLASYVRALGFADIITSTSFPHIKRIFQVCQNIRQIVIAEKDHDLSWPNGLPLYILPNLRRLLFPHIMIRTVPKAIPSTITHLSLGTFYYASSPMTRRFRKILHDIFAQNKLPSLSYIALEIDSGAAFDEYLSVIPEIPQNVRVILLMIDARRGIVRGGPKVADARLKEMGDGRIVAASAACAFLGNDIPWFDENASSCGLLRYRSSKMSRDWVPLCEEAWSIAECVVKNRMEQAIESKARVGNMDIHTGSGV